MAITRAINPSLYTPIYDKHAVEGYKEVPKVFPKIFTIVTDDTSEYKTHQLGGLAMMGEIEEIGEIPSQKLEELWPKTFTPVFYGDRVVVSKAATGDDEYAIMKKSTIARLQGKGAARKADQKAADVINGMFASTQTPDGSYLVATDHPYSPTDSTTLSNKITTALSPDALDEMEIKIADNCKDSKGQVVDIWHNILLVPPALNGTAIEICDKRAWAFRGTADRVLNRFAGVYEVLMWRRMAVTSYTTTAWALVAPKMEYGLKFIWRERPHYNAWYNDNIRAYVFDLEARFDVGADGWRCIFASDGSG